MNNQDSPNGGSYRAAQGNLNAVISNPSVNINDTMNMNIQNMNSTSNNYQVNLNTISNNDVSKINKSIKTFNYTLNYLKEILEEEYNLDCYIENYNGIYKQFSLIIVTYDFFMSSGFI